MVTTKKAKSKLSPTANKKRKKVKVKVPKTENIIFIGSEMHYDSFWLKMMFIGAAYVMASKLRKAHKNTIAYVDEGYTRYEKLTLDALKDAKGFEIVKLSSSDDIVTLMNKDRKDYKLQDVYFSSHGVVGKIALNYAGDSDIDLTERGLKKIQADAFMPNGQIYSYACRTGISVNNDGSVFNFSNDKDAKPELSLAQKMADHFGVSVHAFLRRSNYGAVIREKSQSSSISSTLKKARESQDGTVIDIPPEHEGLPHPGLGSSSSWSPFNSGAEKEGTDEYALWRKHGGRTLPATGDTPKGLSAGMRIFTKA
jgi:hypothetical protein